MLRNILEPTQRSPNLINTYEVCTMGLLLRDGRSYSSIYCLWARIIDFYSYNGFHAFL